MKTENKNMHDISSIKRVSMTFLEVSRCSRANNGKKCKKKCVARAKLFFFLLIRPIVVFSQFSLRSPLKVMLERNDSQRRFLAQHSRVA